MNKIKGIFKDESSGKWFVSTTFTTNDGYYIKKTKRGFKRLMDAKKWKDDMYNYYKNNSIESSGELKSDTLKLVESYLSNRKVNMKISSYLIIKNYLNNHFVDYFNNYDINKLKPYDINEYYLWIASKDLKPKTKNMILSTVMVMLEWLDTMEYINPNIYRKFKQIIKKIKVVESPKSDFLTPKEITKLLNSFNEFEIRERVMFEVLCYGGLRKSELRALTIKDIDKRRNTISINKQLQSINQDGKIIDLLVNYTKTNNNRIIKMPEFVINDIINLDNNNDYLFPYAGNKINKILDKHLELSNIKKVKVHDLRHSYCTMLYDAGASSKFVQKQLGHKSDRTSRDIYEHLTYNMEKKGNEIIKKLG